MSIVPSSQKASPLPHATRRAWLIGLALSSLVLACAWFFSDMRYAVTDDQVLLRSMAGFDTTIIPDYSLYVHGLLLYPLRWLGLLFPGVAWFSWLQIGLLWLSMAVMVKSIFQCFARASIPWPFAFFASALFINCFAYYYCARITYTTTSAALGGAAVLHMLSIDTRKANDRSIVRAQWLGLALLSLAYALRQVTLLPAAAFYLIAAFTQGMQMRGKRSLKPLLTGLMITAAALLCFVGLRAVESARPDQRAYQEWQQQSIRLRDYYNVQDIPQDTLDEIGWSQNELALIDEWYYMDRSITVEAFEKAANALEEASSATPAQRLAGVASQFKLFSLREPLGRRTLWVLNGLFALCIVGFCIGPRRNRIAAVGVGLAALCCSALLGYLAFEGRMPLRAAMTVILPCAALMVGLLPRLCVPPSGRTGRIALSFVACCFLLLCSRYLIPMAKELASDTGTESVAAYEALDAYGADHPDLLFIRDNTFGNDYRLFPTTQNGIPKNVLYWGGWGARSSFYNELLGSFGFDPENWDASCFLASNVRLLRATPEIPEKLLAYLNESAAIECVLEGVREGVYCFSFRLTSAARNTAFLSVS